jgi:putative flippase GtrA
MKHREIPFEFRSRRAGESKLDFFEAWQLLCFLTSKAIGSVLPPSLVSFLAVGGSGVIVHFGVLYPTIWLEIPFSAAQLGAALVATAWNFGLNNSLTFRDRRLRGWSILPGFAKYLGIATVGIAANVAVASAAFDQSKGFIALSALAGIAVDTVWKYFMSSLLIWKSGYGRKRRAGPAVRTIDSTAAGSSDYHVAKEQLNFDLYNPQCSSADRHVEELAVRSGPAHHHVTAEGAPDRG